MRAGWLILAALLAGCADAPAAEAPPTFSDVPVPRGRDFPLLVWSVLAAQDFTVASAREAAVPVQVPNGTLSVSANVTLRAGAAFGFGVAVDACRWSREAAFVAGQSFAADCGGVGEGAQSLVLRTTAGALAGRVEVVGFVCVPDPTRLSCPAPFPPQTS